ncbi:hypothetical protein B0I37DRAFT_413548 [Chaetomium sp. MPI-CAGE-AT-0009]|nr:hypothetical protein B0I37DRAFT_413548 [Chaetomium sp. MPI-CAGE-AT-0009]
MDNTTEKAGTAATAKATKASKRANRERKSVAALIEAGMLEDAFNETQCGNCDRLRKTTYIWGLAFWFMVFFYLIVGVAAVTLVHANQIDAGGSDAGNVVQLVARGFEADTTTSVMDSACSVSTSITYPAPSAAFVSETSEGTITTGGVTVTPIASQVTQASVCPGPETVTVTVTTVTGNDAVTAGAGGAPPQTSEGSTTSSSVLATVTMTETYTVTDTATMGTATSSAETESTTQTSSTSTDTVTTHVTSTTTQFITMHNSTGTTTVTVDPRTAGTGGGNTPSLISTLGSMVVGTGTGTGTGIIMATGTGIPQASTNGSLTYSVPTVSPSQVLPSVVSSSGSSTRPPFGLAIRGGNSGGEGAGKRDQRGGKSGFYCIVMAVACAVAVLV